MYFGHKYLKGHLERHDFAQPQARALRAALAKCKEVNVPEENSDCPVPYPGGPPVEDLEVLSGYACSQVGCMHAQVSEKGMKAHQSEDHPNKPPAFHAASVQHLFSLPVRYFSVEPSLLSDHLDEEEMSLLECLIQATIPNATEAPPIITASDDRGRTPLENHFRWDELLLPVRKSRRMLMLLADLKQRHLKEEEKGLYTALHEAVKDWHEGIRKDLTGKLNSLDLTQFVMHGSYIPPEGSVIMSSC